MPSQRDRLRVGAAVLGAVAVLTVVGRITSPEEPASQPRPTLATTWAPPLRSSLPERWVTQQLDVGHGGGPLMFGAGSLWVGAWRDREVVRIDPRSNRVAARFPAGGPNPAGLAVDAATIWAVHPDTDEVVRLDPRTGRVVARIRLDPLPFQFAPGDRRFLPSLVAVGAGAGWVGTSRGAVARIDAASNRVAVIKLARQGAEGIAVAGRIVWVAEGGHGVARIDAATNRLLGRFGSTSRPIGLLPTAGRSGSAVGRRIRASRRLGLWPGSTPRPAGSARSSQAVCRLAWRPASERSGSPSGTLLERRWSASGRTRAPQP
jgi:streptogramin lyase